MLIEMYYGLRKGNLTSLLEILQCYYNILLTNYTAFILDSRNKHMSIVRTMFYIRHSSKQQTCFYMFRCDEIYIADKCLIII